LALIYIDRLIQRNNFLLTELNVHRVVITSVLLAAKFFDDAYYNNAYYAKVGGVLVNEINGLEVDYLFRINFSLHAAPEEFAQYRMELLSHSAIAVQSTLRNMNDTVSSARFNVDAPPPAQVSPEVHSSATPTTIASTAISMEDGTQVDAFTYQHDIVPPPSSLVVASNMKQEQVVTNVVPPDNMSYHEPSKNDFDPKDVSYFGFPLQAHPVLHHHLHRRNSLSSVLPTPSSPLYEPPFRGPPASDPVLPIRCSQQQNHHLHQPMNIMPQFPQYSDIDASSSLLYSGNVVMMDHDRRIQQHLWGGTPITVVHHHHHHHGVGTLQQQQHQQQQQQQALQQQHYVTTAASTTLVGSGLLHHHH
jgi:Cyclin